MTPDASGSSGSLGLQRGFRIGNQMFGSLVDQGLGHVQSGGRVMRNRSRLHVLLEERLLPADLHFGLVDFRQTSPLIRRRDGNVFINVLRVIRLPAGLASASLLHFR